MRAADDPSCAGREATVWYAYTPAEDTLVEASTLGSDYPTTISAYTGTRGALSQVACGDEWIRFVARAGQTSYVVVRLGPPAPHISDELHNDAKRGASLGRVVAELGGDRFGGSRDRHRQSREPPLTPSGLVRKGGRSGLVVFPAQQIWSHSVPQFAWH